MDTAIRISSNLHTLPVHDHSPLVVCGPAALYLSLARDTYSPLPSQEQRCVGGVGGSPSQERWRKHAPGHTFALRACHTPAIRLPVAREGGTRGLTGTTLMQHFVSRRCPPCCHDAARRELGHACPWVHDILALFGSALVSRVPQHRLEALAPCRRSSPADSATVPPSESGRARLRLLG
jgi:hypothetical protein